MKDSVQEKGIYIYDIDLDTIGSGNCEFDSTIVSSFTPSYLPE